MKSTLKKLLFSSKYYRLSLAIMLFYFVPFFSKAQNKINLIPNPSFEYDTCIPYSWKPWTYPLNTAGLAIVNVCSGFLPTNQFDPLKYPRSYEGVSINSFYNLPYNYPGINNFSDYIQTNLKSELLFGHTYAVSFYVNLCATSDYAVDQIGAYVDDGSLLFSIPNQVSVATAQAYSPIGLPITDTLNWTKIQGCFVANGTENRLIIGRFTDTMNVHSVVLNNPLKGFQANYYIDDVSVVDLGSKIKAGSDTTINAGDTVVLGLQSTLGLPCDWYDMQGNKIAASSICTVHPMHTTSYIVKMDLCGNLTSDTIKVKIKGEEDGIQDSNRSLLLAQIYPNPNSGNFTVVLPNDNFQISITDLSGRAIRYNCKNSGTNQQIELTEAASGLYFITIQNNTTHEKYIKKITIQ